MIGPIAWASSGRAHTCKRSSGERRRAPDGSHWCRSRVAARDSGLGRRTRARILGSRLNRDRCRRRVWRNVGLPGSRFRRRTPILLYVEGVNHARRFMSGLRAAARMKPVIVLKAGRHHEASRAAATHTGALLGDDAVFASALRRAGAVRVTSLEELFSAAGLLARGCRTQGERLAIVSNAGGLGVMAADRIAECGVQLSALAEPTMQALDAALPEHWSHANPVDLIGDAAPNAKSARSISCSPTRVWTPGSCCSPHRR